MPLTESEKTNVIGVLNFYKNSDVIDKVFNSNLNTTAKRLSYEIKELLDNKINIPNNLHSILEDLNILININELLISKISCENDEESQYINTNDKYFKITMSTDKNDGSIEYIKESLIKNFKHMFPPSFKAKAWVYSTAIVDDNTVILDGLIRYDANNKYNISTTSAPLKNIIKMEGTKIKNSRHLTVENLTKYHKKQYMTNKDDVINTYNNIAKNNNQTGDLKIKFL